jgi:hypothetical protein
VLHVVTFSEGARSEGASTAPSDASPRKGVAPA